MSRALGLAVTIVIEVWESWKSIQMRIDVQ